MVYDRNALAKEHIHRVEIIAKKHLRYLPSSVNIDDLVSFGMIGLVYALRGYDPERNNQFQTYATLRITGAMLDGLRNWYGRKGSARREAVVFDINSDDISIEILDGYSPEALAEKKETVWIVRKAIKELPPKERAIVTMHDLEGKTLEEIGKVFDLTESRIGQIRKEALLHLRTKLEYRL